MNDNMYFIAIIADALSKPDPKQAMREAFKKIHSMGQQPEYALGYRQFLEFMDSMPDSDKDAPERIGAKMLKDADRPTSIELLLEKDNATIAKRLFKGGDDIQTFDKILPGCYRLKMDTGRIIWEGNFEKQDIIWAEAYPTQNLRMAADTGQKDQRPTKEVYLLDGTLILRIFPGVESGILEIELKRPEAKV